MSRIFNYILIILGTVSFVTANVFPQTIMYRTLPGSRMWIEGTSTLNDYTCKTNDVVGYGEVDQIPDTSIGSAGENKAFLTIMVQSLNCGKELMNEDMYHAMKSKKFPFIRYELLNARLIPDADSAGGWFKLRTIGNLSIAGDTSKVNITMKVKEIKNGIYRLIGSKSLVMKQFGIIPPSHFFGLIRAHEALTVHFDLLAANSSVSEFVVHNHDIKAH